jgi:hypothetical protein
MVRTFQTARRLHNNTLVELSSNKPHLYTPEWAKIQHIYGKSIFQEDRGYRAKRRAPATALPSAPSCQPARTSRPVMTEPKFFTVNKIYIP